MWQEIVDLDFHRWSDFTWPVPRCLIVYACYMLYKNVTATSSYCHVKLPIKHIHGKEKKTVTHLWLCHSPKPSRRSRKARAGRPLNTWRWCCPQTLWWSWVAEPGTPPPPGASLGTLCHPDAVWPCVDMVVMRWNRLMLGLMEVTTGTNVATCLLPPLLSGWRRHTAGAESRCWSLHTGRKAWWARRALRLKEDSPRTTSRSQNSSRCQRNICKTKQKETHKQQKLEYNAFVRLEPPGNINKTLWG